MVTYDSIEAASTKAEYIKKNGLGGAMWWESSGDHPSDTDRSIISLMNQRLSHYGSLENTQNNLDYPYSKWDNVRENMPETG